MAATSPRRAADRRNRRAERHDRRFSTALPEQAVRDILASAFQSAGQRCSALRCLYVQEDVAGHLPRDALRRDGRAALGDPWDLRPMSAR
jgi:acyl-CoA reductase-like NAD-dependent aldehyde dehydrogenase